MKNTTELRKHLSEEMQLLRCGKVTTQEAAQTAKLADTIVKSINSDLADKRMEIKLKRSIPKNPKPLKL